MNIENLSIKQPQKRENNPILPSSLRGLIVGSGNSGKTVLLLNLLLREGWLDYNNLLVFGNSLQQDEYQIMEKGFEIIEASIQESRSCSPFKGARVL